MEHLAKIENILSYKFQDRKWLERAITHSSMDTGPNYERLEFLGDRVLGVIVAEILFRKYPEEREGALAKRFSALVRGKILATIGQEIGIEEYISSSAGHNENVIADVMEALIGAVYIDGGLAPCKAFIEKYWAEHLKVMVRPPQDPKTQLQEWAQAQKLKIPTYEIVGQEGPDHAPEFTVRVSVQGYPPQEATASNRRQGEKNSARKFLKEQNVS